MNPWREKPEAIKAKAFDRLMDMVKQLNALDLAHRGTQEALGAVFKVTVPSIEKRLDELEQLALRLDRESHADGFDERIRELESLVHAIDKEVASGNWEPNSERDRKARWHATLNACLTRTDSLDEARQIANALHGEII